MAKFRDPKALQLHLKKALDFMVAETIEMAQSQLGSEDVSPKDTGRFRSSWFAAEGRPSREVAPEGANSPRTDAQGLSVNSNRTYYLSNNLEYAESVAIEGKVVSQPVTWFKTFRDQQIPRIQEQAAENARNRFEL